MAKTILLKFTLGNWRKPRSPWSLRYLLSAVESCLVCLVVALLIERSIAEASRVILPSCPSTLMLRTALNWSRGSAFASIRTGMNGRDARAIAHPHCCTSTDSIKDAESFKRMFEKYQKSLRSAVVPPVIGNHGLTGRSLLKQTEDSRLIEC
jgi:hypothetical protein